MNDSMKNAIALPSEQHAFRYNHVKARSGRSIEIRVRSITSRETIALILSTHSGHNG